MPAERVIPKIIVEFVDDIATDAVADAFADDLQSNTVSRWAEDVRIAISESPRLDKKPTSNVDPDLSQQKVQLASQIAELQRRLAQLEGSGQ